MVQPRLIATGPAQQRGIVLVVALIVLVVMALVGLGMMRQTTSGVSIAGNVSMRQSAPWPEPIPERIRPLILSAAAVPAGQRQRRQSQQ